MKIFFTFFFFLCCLVGTSQENSFPYGQINVGHLFLKSYDKDSSANAVVLKEFGESYVSTDQEKGLIFEHHYIIKILKAGGLNEANVVIPIYKGGLRNQSLISIKASSYNLENNKIQETKVDSRTLFTENVNKYWDNKKITIPNVRVGSVIEVQYKLSDPFFVSNFHPWLFQSHLPKVSSEYWATIPANYDYNITWKGYLKLKKNEGKLLKDCFDLGGQYKADCGRYIFLMENIPAFTEEEYMTAKSNFIAGVNFELSEIRHFDGRVDKVTKEWKDADSEVQQHKMFGGQLKKGKEIFQKIEPLLVGVTDPTEKAKKIYTFINNGYTWNEYYGMYSEEGIKKAFDSKKGNIGDINLSLIAALRYAEFDVEPLLLSTRSNGLPIELHPVLTDFNYVVAKLNIGDKVYLLDATERFMPFGMLPERCLNGKGRAFPERKPSYWFDLKATEKNKTVSILNLAVQPSGKIIGTIEFSHFGYDAVDKRKEILSFDSPEKYVQELSKEWTSVTIEKSEITGVDDLESIIKEKFEVEIDGFDDMNNDNLLLNPFFSGKIENNPFRLTERLYPVDFGPAPDITVILNLTYPADVVLVSKPERNVYALQGGSGKFLFDILETENKVTMNFVLSINKSVFNSNEYPSLKELFNRVVQTQSTDLIFQRKK
jgi:hypothetical protein